MKEVTHEYGFDLLWKENLAKQLGGHIDGNYLSIPAEVHDGTRYVLQVSPFTTVQVIDVTYNQSVTFHQRNTGDDFVGIYYNLTEGNAIHVLDDVSKSMGRWDYNLAFMDSSLDADYIIEKGSKTYMICIFISKLAFRNYLAKLPQFEEILDVIFDQEQNTFIRYERMSNQAWWLIKELREMEMDDPLYDVLLKGTVYALLDDYMEQINQQEMLIEKVVKEDLTAVISSQSMLLDQLTESFPGIPLLAGEACMSETRYKSLFKKITGLSPNAFFLSNKLSFAKQMLETGAHSIGEVSDHFNFSNASHFTELFKNSYGIAPKDHLSYL